jgi:hypothetical protein
MTTSLATVAGRQEIPFTVPKHALQYLGGRVCSADLCFHHGRYFLHIVVELEVHGPVAPTGEVIGVDLGINRPAVTSTRQFLGDRRWKEQERRLFRLRADLQASYTIRDKHLACLASIGRSFAGGSPVKRPLVSTRSLRKASQGQAPGFSRGVT